MVAPSALDNKTTQTEMISSDYFLLTHLKKRKSIQNCEKEEIHFGAHLAKSFLFFLGRSKKKERNECEMCVTQTGHWNMKSEKRQAE